MQVGQVTVDDARLPQVADLAAGQGLSALADALAMGHLAWPLWCAFDGDRVLGLLEGRLDMECFDERWAPEQMSPPQAWVFHLAVRRAERRQGVGRALLRRFAVDAAAAGCTFLALAVQEDAAVAGRREFFRRCGLERLNVDACPPMVMGATLAAVLS